MANRPLITSLFLLSTLTACGVTNHKSHITAQAGIPILLGFWSSGVQVTPDAALTVQHGVAFGEIVRKAPLMDAMLVERQGSGAVPVGERVVEGQKVVVRGTDPFGQPLEYRTEVWHPWIWACEPFAKPDPRFHPISGPCTRKGKAYTYGFSVPRGPITQGWSGGGVYNEAGELVGMIAQEGTTDDGNVIGWAYHADMLKAELQW